MKSKELKASRRNISMKKEESIEDKLMTHEELKDKLFGKEGSMTRRTYEQGFEAFKLGSMIKGLREKQHLTQEQLAVKCGTTKSYISRIENNASDIRLSTLVRIVSEGLGSKLILNVA